MVRSVSEAQSRLGPQLWARRPRKLSGFCDLLGPHVVLDVSQAVTALSEDSPDLLVETPQS